MAKRAWTFSRRAQWTLFGATVALGLLAAYLTGSGLAIPAVAVPGALVAWFLERKNPSR